MQLPSILFLCVIGMGQPSFAQPTPLLELVLKADHQIEIYVADRAPDDFDSVLTYLGNSDLAVTLLVSPDAASAEDIVRRAEEAFSFIGDVDPPTLCVLQEAGSEQDMIVVDHLSYRADFQPEKAKAFVGVFDGAMSEFSFPASTNTAELMEGLSGTCNF